MDVDGLDEEALVTGRLKDLNAEDAVRRNLPAPASSAAALPAPPARVGRHELSPELSALITAAVPPNTAAAWVSRFDRGFRPWAVERYGADQVMPPTDEMLSEYLRHLGYGKGLKVASLEAHLGTILGVAKAWVAKQCAERATWRAGREAERAARHQALDAEEELDAASPPPDTAARAEARDAARRVLDGQELADARHQHQDPKTPDTLLSRLVIDAYARKLAQDPAAETEPRKATGLTPQEYRAIILKTGEDSSPAGRRDRALIAVWYSIFRRSAETSRLATTDITFSAEHGMRVTIRYSKTNTSGRKRDVINIPFARDPLICPVRIAKAWLDYLATEDDRRPGAPRYAKRGQTRPLWPRIDRHGYLGPQAWSSGEQDDGGLGTKALARILAKRAGAAGVQLSGVEVDKLGEEHQRRVSTHSMRRGPITAALNGGKSLGVVGRHAGFADGSRTIYAYWDHTDRPWDPENNAFDGLL